MIKACLFDLYGILVSANKCGADVGTHEMPYIPKDKSLDSLSHMGVSTGLSSDDNDQRVWENSQSYFEHKDAEIPDMILPGALEFVRELYRKGIKLASTTTACKPEEVLSSVGLYGMFNYIVDPAQVADRPSPEALLKASNHLGVSPQECIAFEHTPEGIEAAKAAGMRSVGVGDLTRLYAAEMGVPNLKGLTLQKMKDAIEQRASC